MAETGGVELIEAGMQRAVDIEHTPQATGDQHRQDDLAVRGRIAGDMTGERMHIFDHLDLPAAGAGAAHALVEGDAHAGDFALERAEDQFLAAIGLATIDIEAGPVQARYLRIDQRTELAEVGKQVALTGDETLQLFSKRLICVGFLVRRRHVESAQGIGVHDGKWLQRPYGWRI